MIDIGVDAKILTSPGDNAIRWRYGERLEDLFEDHCDALRRAGRGGDLALDGPAGRLTYDELDAVDGYVCMLAVLKAHAVYVPLDPGFPADRISYIVADADVRTVLSHSRLAGLVAKPGPEVVYVDQAAVIAAEKGERLTVVDTGAPLGDLCSVIYTSGTTGRPKGVTVSHPSICNFVRVAAETYGYAAADRVYQGLTMAFDFAIEETWVPWLSGATLVPKPRGPQGGNLLGPDLASFLREQRISALCCVPALLATLDEELPQLRFLLVSGEACPPELADRWHRPGRRRAGTPPPHHRQDQTQPRHDRAAPAGALPDCRRAAAGQRPRLAGLGGHRRLRPLRGDGGRRAGRWRSPATASPATAPACRSPTRPRSPTTGRPAARTRTSHGSTGCSRTPAAVLTCPPRSSSNACKAKAGSTWRLPPGCAGWPSAASGTASC